MPSYDDIPRLVSAWSDGDPKAFDELVTLLYDDLRALAHDHLRREQDGHTLGTTALVHEAYLQLAGKTGPTWRGQPQFFAFLAKVMRHVLVDYARRRSAAKRGGAPIRVELRDRLASADPGAIDMLALNEALCRLAEKDPHLATVVECRFFGGLTQGEIAEALGISERTVERHWSRARAYLYRLLAVQPVERE